MIRAGSIVSLRAKNVKVPAKLNLRARMYLSLAQTSAQITKHFRSRSESLAPVAPSHFCGAVGAARGGDGWYHRFLCHRHE